MAYPPPPGTIQTHKGCTKKNSLNLRNSFCLISPATNMIDNWNIIHLKNEIHSSVWSTKTFLYDIRELFFRAKQYWVSDFKTLYCPISNIFGILLPHFDLPLSQLPNIVQKKFCTSDGTIDLTFQMNYVPAVYHVCSQRH